MNKLQEGITAPAIDTTDIHGQRVNPFDDGKWTFVAFHRFSNCPFCNLRTQDLINNYGRFQEHDIEIVSIWPSGRDNMLKHVGRDQAPFPIVSDSAKLLFQQYGVTRSSKLAALMLAFAPKTTYRALQVKTDQSEIDADPFLLPAEFLITPDAIVAKAHYGRHYGDHLPIDQIIDSQRSFIDEASI